MSLHHGGAAVAASAPVNLLLDGSLAALTAYSFWRKLRTAYAGSAFRVRRSSDSTELDIGFSGSSVDTAALIAFGSGTSCFVKTLYDQSGNGRDLAQATTTKQPRIVNAGTMDKLGATAAGAVWDGGDDMIKRADGSGLAFGSPACTIASAWLTTVGTKKLYTLGADNQGGSIGLFYNGPQVSIDYANTAIPFTPSPVASTAAYWVQTHPASGNASTGSLRQNGAALTGGGATNGSTSLIFNNAGNTVLGALAADSFNAAMKLGAFMVFGSVLTGADLTAVETELALHLG